ncbi:MAG: molybdopterin-binding protein, partial [Candidatus Gastranaerophilales bacterium]|nr:molybdopterin-binding protein [Candidatus Gastranaerophilales bacterium]
MTAEILCIGTELLLGETVNTNASYISKKLASIGISCFYQTTVGDNSERIKAALDIALNRSNIIIVTGGLGPTGDDITVKSIAEYFNEDLILDEDSLSNIEKFFKSINKVMPDTNIKQAFRPKNAEVILNPVGTAPGFIWEINDVFETQKVILTFPGVPIELYAMWD